VPALDKVLLWQELKRGELRPAYLLFGAETYLRDTAARTISEKAFGEDDFRDLNETTFELTTDPDDLRHAITAAEQLPMMAARRLVRITGVRISATGFRDSVVEEHEELLKSYLSSPSPTSTVVIIADELNGNRKISKLLKDLCAAVEFKPLEDSELFVWTRKEFDRLGSSASDAVIRLLIARAGTDMHRLGNEINKVATAALPSGVVTEGLIDTLVATSRELDNFALTRYLVAGSAGKAIASLKKLLDDGTEPLALIGSIAYTYRQLMMAKDLMARGLDRRQVVGSLRVRYSDQEPILAAARRSNVAALTKAIQEIAKADIAIKTSIGGSTSGGRIQIEMLVAKLALLSSN
jgi:DNA polymerase-3 subunit delta